MSFSDRLHTIQFKIVTWGLGLVMQLQRLRFREIRERFAEHDLVAQVRLRDGSAGRYYVFKRGKVSSRRGIHPRHGVKP